MDESREDLWKLAYVSATIFNAQPLYGKHKRKTVKPEDLFASLKLMDSGGRKGQTPDEMLMIARIVHAKFKASEKAKAKRGMESKVIVSRAQGPITNR